MLTELDNCILGVIWREGPMSAYGVRSHFAGSTTVEWSSSTGTVYPAIRRLTEAGLVRASKPEGPRKSRTLSITPSGLKSLRDWLLTATPELGSSTADPIRTRVQFLAALEPATRAAVLADYRAATRAVIDRFEQRSNERGDSVAEQLDQMGTLGALAELRARLEWLQMIEPRLSALDSSSSR